MTELALSLKFPRAGVEQVSVTRRPLKLASLNISTLLAGTERKNDETSLRPGKKSLGSGHRAGRF